MPLPLDREATARALGFGSVEHNVAAVQLGRGKLEAAVLAWCGELGHDLARFSSDVILFSAEEYGYLVLPARLATGSSIMPHKRNPDLFELTRARAATVNGDHAALWLTTLWRFESNGCPRLRWPLRRSTTCATAAC